MEPKGVNQKGAPSQETIQAAEYLNPLRKDIGETTTQPTLTA